MACTPAPISAQIRNVSIANAASNAEARGIAISIGTPAQDFAFMPYPFNNSFVFDSSNNCGYGGNFPDVSDAACITWRGGAYSASASKTSKVSANYTITDPSPYPSSSGYSDTWVIGDDDSNSTTIDSFSFGVPWNDWGEQYYYPQNLLGLGPESTFLTDLKDAGIIASRTFSIFWGLDGTSSAGYTNGSIVFGGFDEKKVSGANYTAKLNYTSCLWGTWLEISDLNMVNSAGALTSMMEDTSDPLYACIDFGRPGMFDMPYDHFASFVKETNYTTYNENVGSNNMRSFGLNFYDLMYYPIDDRYSGNFRISFEAGLEITISNDQFVVPHVYVDSDTGLWSQNLTEYDLLINSGPMEGDDSMLRLGRHATTFLYTMVNLDAGEFTVWAANKESNSESLVAVDENNDVVSSVGTDCTASAADSSSSSQSSAGSSSGSGSSDSGTSGNDEISPLSGGTIAGIAVGSAAGLALVVAVGWWLLRRRKVADGYKVAELPGSLSQSQTPLQQGQEFDTLKETVHMHAAVGSDQVSELPTNTPEHMLASELAEETPRPRYELDG